MCKAQSHLAPIQCPLFDIPSSEESHHIGMEGVEIQPGGPLRNPRIDVWLLMGKTSMNREVLICFNGKIIYKWRMNSFERKKSSMEVCNWKTHRIIAVAFPSHVWWHRRVQKRGGDHALPDPLLDLGFWLHGAAPTSKASAQCSGVTRRCHLGW